MGGSTSEDRPRQTVIKRLSPPLPHVGDSDDRDADVPGLDALPGRRAALLRWAVLAAVAAVLALWLVGTPPGLEGKLRAVGYAICHQVKVRTFVAGDVVMPLCARCTGTFLGVIVGFVGPVLLLRGRAGRLPHPLVTAVLLLFTGMWVVDGGNSYLSLFSDEPLLYEPRNELRLLTGSLQGLTMASFVYPVFNNSVWRRWRPERSLRHLGDLAFLVGGVLLLDALVLVREPVLLAVMGGLSTLGVLAIMTAIQTVIVVLVTRRANRISTWGDLALPLIVGFGLAMILIGLVDAGRYALFGSWEGMTLGE